MGIWRQNSPKAKHLYIPEYHPPPDPGTFLMILRHCKIGHFSTIWLTSHGNFIVDVSFDKEVPIKFQRSPDVDPDLDSGFKLQIWIGFALAEVCALQVLLLIDRLFSYHLRLSVQYMLSPHSLIHASNIKWLYETGTEYLLAVATDLVTIFMTLICSHTSRQVIQCKRQT